MPFADVGSTFLGPGVFRERLRRAADEARQRGLSAILVTPSIDYAYLLGYLPPVLERLTCLVVSARGVPSLVLPQLEEPLARHRLGDLAAEIELVAWAETQDPFAIVGDRVAAAGGDGRGVAVQDQMWATFVLRLQAALDGTELSLAGACLSSLRRVKSADEVARLRAAARAADAAMLRITTERLSGRTEASVSERIRQLLLEAGHDTADFAIVGSGPNSASPHHEPGERVIGAGDAIVLDIGGSRDGYCSDTTRTAFVGEPPQAFRELYDVLQAAQAAACEAVVPGVPAEAVDAAARRVIDEAGYGPQFIHRTGHGIGMETHEEPYVVAGNGELLRPGDAFSIEPGIYVSGRWGARIEDIVVCTPDGGERLNQTPRTLYLVE
jgi:Xaa-Pro aminopeptidase